MFFLYPLDILIVAFPLALFEIMIERGKGWGGGWSKSGWFARPFAPESRLVKSWARFLRIERPLNYHMIVFAVVIPLVFLAELLFWANDIPLILACYVGTLVFEDFFWFLLNWHFPGSLRELLKGPRGAIWWHKDWTRIGRDVYLPAAYLPSFLVSIALLLVA